MLLDCIQSTELSQLCGCSCRATGSAVPTFDVARVGAMQDMVSCLGPHSRKPSIHETGSFPASFPTMPDPSQQGDTLAGSSTTLTSSSSQPGHSQSAPQPAGDHWLERPLKLRGVGAARHLQECMHLCRGSRGVAQKPQNPSATLCRVVLCESCCLPRHIHFLTALCTMRIQRVEKLRYGRQRVLPAGWTRTWVTLSQS